MACCNQNLKNISQIVLVTNYASPLEFSTNKAVTLFFLRSLLQVVLNSGSFHAYRNGLTAEFINTVKFENAYNLDISFDWREHENPTTRECK